MEVTADPPVRAGHVVLGRQAWHEVAVLKFVHQRFVLDRPDLAMFQRGQAEALTSLVANLESWLTDPVDAGRAPRRLVDLVELATAGLPAGGPARSPELLVGPTGEPATSRDDVVRLGRGRGIIDYVASLTDDRAGGLRAHPGRPHRAAVGRRVGAVSTGRPAGSAVTKRRTVAGGGGRRRGAAGPAGRLGEPVRRPQRRAGGDRRPTARVIRDRR